jgi:hypothetical protein
MPIFKVLSEPVWAWTELLGGGIKLVEMRDPNPRVQEACVEDKMAIFLRGAAATN